MFAHWTTFFFKLTVIRFIYQLKIPFLLFISCNNIFGAWCKCWTPKCSVFGRTFYMADYLPKVYLYHVDHAEKIPWTSFSSIFYNSAGANGTKIIIFKHEHITYTFLCWSTFRKWKWKKGFEEKKLLISHHLSKWKKAFYREDE